MEHKPRISTAFKLDEISALDTSVLQVIEGYKPNFINRIRVPEILKRLLGKTITSAKRKAPAA